MDQVTSSTQEPQATPLPVEGAGNLHHKKNLYPYTRHVLLGVAVLFALSVIIFLIYQNGKSIYDNGL